MDTLRFSENKFLLRSSFLINSHMTCKFFSSFAIILNGVLCHYRFFTIREKICTLFTVFVPIAFTINLLLILIYIILVTSSEFILKELLNFQSSLPLFSIRRKSRENNKGEWSAENAGNTSYFEVFGPKEAKMDTKRSSFKLYENWHSKFSSLCRL